MKKLFYLLVLPALWSCLSGTAQKPVFEEHISKSFDIQGLTALGVYNLNGSIYAEGYNGNEIKIEIDQKITGKDAAGLEEGKRKVKLTFETIEGKLYVFLEEPWNTAPQSIRPQKEHRGQSERVPYEIEMDIKLKVPNKLKLDVSTINKGNVTVERFNGVIAARNVNGGITISDASEVQTATSVNGPVTVSFTQSPRQSSLIKTVNGKITLTYPPDLAGEFSMKTMNGEYFTNFDYTTSTGGMSKVVNEDQGVKKYKISQQTRIQIGNGGSQHSTETLNGDIYIKKNI